MKRQAVPLRPDWRQRHEELGFSFHSVGGEYWREGVCYSFTADQVDRLEAVSERLHHMCLEAVQYVIDRDLFSRMGFDDYAAELARTSWQRDDLSLYGRLDLRYDGIKEPKLLEYNADTPTSLFESGIAQWVWLEDSFPERDQFNSIHEKLLETFGAVKGKMPIVSNLLFACVRDHDEDLVTTEYLRDAASQAGIPTKHLFIDEIGFDPAAGRFIDLEDESIDFLFKLYPWEWLLKEEFGRHIATAPTVFLEPPWKMLLSCKGILPVLWEMFPGHENLLPAFFDGPSGLDSYVKKPLFSREGANVEVFAEGSSYSTPGMYGAEGAIYQEFAPLPEFEGNYPVVGSWIIGGLPAGIGIREDAMIITTNTSRFVPHYFE